MSWLNIVYTRIHLFILGYPSKRLLDINIKQHFINKIESIVIFNIVVYFLTKYVTLFHIFTVITRFRNSQNSFVDKSTYFYWTMSFLFTHWTLKFENNFRIVVQIISQFTNCKKWIFSNLIQYKMRQLQCLFGFTPCLTILYSIY